MARHMDEKMKKVGERAREFALRHLTLDARQRYMRLLLQEYAKLFAFKVSRPPDAPLLEEFLPGDGDESNPCAHVDDLNPRP